MGFFQDSWRVSCWHHVGWQTKASMGIIVAGILTLRQWRNLISLILREAGKW